MIQHDKAFIRNLQKHQIDEFQKKGLFLKWLCRSSRDLSFEGMKAIGCPKCTLSREQIYIHRDSINKRAYLSTYKIAGQNQIAGINKLLNGSSGGYNTSKLEYFSLKSDGFLPPGAS